MCNAGWFTTGIQDTDEGVYIHSCRILIVLLLTLIESCQKPQQGLLLTPHERNWCSHQTSASIVQSFKCHDVVTVPTVPCCMHDASPRPRAPRLHACIDVVQNKQSVGLKNGGWTRWHGGRWIVYLHSWCLRSRMYIRLDISVYHCYTHCILIYFQYGGFYAITKGILRDLHIFFIKRAKHLKWQYILDFKLKTAQGVEWSVATRLMVWEA